MRGQWDNYDSFNLVELIDEVKTRVDEPFRVDDTLHGALIVGKDYDGLCKELREFLKRDDKKIKRIGMIGLDQSKKSLLKALMGSVQSKEIDFNKVRDEWRNNNE